MKYYITKWALTYGIVTLGENEVRVVEDSKSLWGKVNHQQVYVTKRDYFTTESEAQARVREMIAKKIKSVQKSLEKLKRLEEDGVRVRALQEAQKS